MYKITYWIYFSNNCIKKEYYGFSWDIIKRIKGWTDNQIEYEIIFITPLIWKFSTLKKCLKKKENTLDNKEKI